MRKQVLFVLPILLTIGSIVSASATETTSVESTITTSINIQPISLERQALQEKARLTRETNKQLRQEAAGMRTDFRTTNSGSLRDMRKNRTEATSIAIKKAQDERREYIQTLSGMTLEQKAEYMSGIEDRIRHEIETRFASATGALQTKRIEVYEQNSFRRAEMIMNQLELRAARGILRTMEIDTMIARITAELPNLSVEKKTKLAKKIDEKITRIQKNKRLPDVSKTDIINKLTALRNDLLK